jgi:hypothetical protein
VRVAGTIDETTRHHVSQPGERTPHARLERQRGLKSFLTWAFFLAQASALESLLTGAAKAQDDEFSENSLKHAETPSGELPNDALQRAIDVAEADIAAAATSGSGASHSAPPADIPSGSPQLAPMLKAPTDHAPPIGAVAGGGSAASGRVGSGGSTDNSLPTLLPEIGGSERDAPPPISVDIGLSPILGFEATVDTGGVIAGVGLDLNLDLGDLLGSPLQAVTGLVDSLVTDLGNLLNGDLLGLGDLLGSTPLNLGELTGLTLTDGLAGLLGPRDGGSVDEPAAAGPDSGALAATLVTDGNELSAPGLLSAGNLIDFPARALAPADDLYAQGRHTDYNIAIHDNTLQDNAHGDVGTTSPTQSDTAGVLLGTLLSQDAQPPTDAAVADLSPLDEFLTRPAV